MSEHVLKSLIELFAIFASITVIIHKKEIENVEQIEQEEHRERVKNFY